MAASGEERQSAESQAESHNDTEQEISENPWPYLDSVFEFDRVKKRGHRQTDIFSNVYCVC